MNPSRVRRLVSERSFPLDVPYCLKAGRFYPLQAGPSTRARGALAAARARPGRSPALDGGGRGPTFGRVSHTDGAVPDIDLAEVDAFAEAAHEGQTRVSGEPYVTHPRGVRAILEHEFPEEVDDSTLAIALLHDVLEDCDVHPGTLHERWGRVVQEGVTLLSWKIRALDLEREPRIYWSGIARGPRAVRLVKAADRLHNLRDTIEHPDERLRTMYLEETPGRLLPILREEGESWFVERLETAIEELREREEE